MDREIGPHLRKVRLDVCEFLWRYRAFKNIKAKFGIGGENVGMDMAVRVKAQRPAIGQGERAGLASIR